MKLIDSIKANEGFVNHVYKDSLGRDTLGYGTLMPINEDEAEMLLVHRLNKMKNDLANRKPTIQLLNKSRQDVLYEMAYQMGVDGVLKFKNMWKAIEQKDYKQAGVEMLDSIWSRQTPERASRLAVIMGRIKTD